MIDPMLATGGQRRRPRSNLMKAAGARTIRMVCIVAAPGGRRGRLGRHPDVHVYTPVVDRN